MCLVKFKELFFSQVLKMNLNMVFVFCCRGLIRRFKQPHKFNRLRICNRFKEVAEVCDSSCELDLLLSQNLVKMVCTGTLNKWIVLEKQVLQLKGFLLQGYLNLVLVILRLLSCAGKILCSCLPIWTEKVLWDGSRYRCVESIRMEFTMCIT